MTPSGNTIVITGATGNTGSYVVKRLIEQQPSLKVTALIRGSSDANWLRDLGVTTHVCDLSLPDTYIEVVDLGSTFLGIANLRFSDEMVPHLIDAGIRRAFCVTTTGVFSSFHSYSSLYREIEGRLLSTRVPMTLLRPSMIYGNVRDHNMHKLIRTLERTPIFPVFGPGTALMQPVFVEDLADGIIAAVRMGAIGEYNLAGPEAISYNDLLASVASALNKQIQFVHLNHRVAARMVKFLQRVPRFPVKHEQVMRLLEDKAFDISNAVDQLGYQPRSFEEGIRRQVNARTSGPES